MNVELNAGFASKYFVTDAEKGVAVAASPALYVSERPVVLLAEGFLGKVLPALKILKLRGMLPVLAIAAPGGRGQLAAAISTLAGMGAGGSPVYVAADRSAAGIREAKGVTVVSGLDRTVMATGLSAEGIVAACPDLCTGPVGAIDEPLI